MYLKIPENFIGLISRMDSSLCMYHLSSWSNFNLLHNLQWITFPTQSYLILYPFCASLLNSFLLIIIVIPCKFFTPALADDLSLNSKSPKVSRTLLSFLVNFNNTIVWMISTCPLISKSCSPFTNPLRIVLSVHITIGITVTLMVYRFFFSSLAKSRYFALFTLFPFFSGLPVWQSPLFERFSFFIDYHLVWLSGWD